MIYVFLGKEKNIINKKIKELIDSLNINNIINIDYSESSLNDILDEVCYVDLFNERKLLFVTDFSFKKIKENEEKRFINYINANDDNVIIFKCIDDKLDERKKLTKILREKGNVTEIQKLDYKELHKYITDMFAKEKKNITFDQVKKILTLCEYNSDIAINETEKLLIYKSDDTDITNEDIDNVISKNYEKELFDFIDNVLKKDIGACFDSYKILKKSNVDEIILLDCLAKEFRLLFQVKSSYRKMNEGLMSKSFGVNPYTIKKIMPYINMYKNDEIINMIYKLSEMDSDIKIKGYDKNKVLELFLMSL